MTSRLGKGRTDVQGQEMQRYTHGPGHLMSRNKGDRQDLETVLIPGIGHKECGHKDTIAQFTFIYWERLSKVTCN